jgi:hypothetical protein
MVQGQISRLIVRQKVHIRDLFGRRLGEELRSDDSAADDYQREEQDDTDHL